MAYNTLNTRFKHRIDSSSNWVVNNPILLLGEIGFESNSLKYKIGNGSDNWNLLPYGNVTPSDLQNLILNTNVMPIITLYLNSSSGNNGTLSEALPSSTVNLTTSITNTWTKTNTISSIFTQNSIAATTSLWQLAFKINNLSPSTSYYIGGKMYLTLVSNSNQVIQLSEITETDASIFTTGAGVTSSDVKLNFNTNFLTSNVPYYANDYFTIELWFKKTGGGTTSATIVSSLTNPMVFTRNGGQITTAYVFDNNGIDTQTQSYRNRSYESSILSIQNSYLPLVGGTMANTNLVTNLNSDLLDGKHSTDFANAAHTHSESDITNLTTDLANKINQKGIWVLPVSGFTPVVYNINDLVTYINKSYICIQSHTLSYENQILLSDNSYWRPVYNEVISSFSSSFTGNNTETYHTIASLPSTERTGYAKLKITTKRTDGGTTVRSTQTLNVTVYFNGVATPLIVIDNNSDDYYTGYYGIKYIRSGSVKTVGNGYKSFIDIGFASFSNATVIDYKIEMLEAYNISLEQLTNSLYNSTYHKLSSLTLTGYNGVMINLGFQGNATSSTSSTYTNYGPIGMDSRFTDTTSKLNKWLHIGSIYVNYNSAYSEKSGGVFQIQVAETTRSLADDNLENFRITLEYLLDAASTSTIFNTNIPSYKLYVCGKLLDTTVDDIAVLTGATSPSQKEFRLYIRAKKDDKMFRSSCENRYMPRFSTTSYTNGAYYEYKQNIAQLASLPTPAQGSVVYSSLSPDTRLDLKENLLSTNTTTKEAVVDNDYVVISDSEASYATKKTRWATIILAWWTRFQLSFYSIISTKSAKMADADGISITDSADSNKVKKMLWSVFKTSIRRLYGPNGTYNIVASDESGNTKFLEVYCNGSYIYMIGNSTNGSAGNLVFQANNSGGVIFNTSGGGPITLQTNSAGQINFATPDIVVNSNNHIQTDASSSVTNKLPTRTGRLMVDERVTISQSSPSGGVDGDIWITY